MLQITSTTTLSNLILYFVHEIEVKIKLI